MVGVVAQAARTVGPSGLRLKTQGFGRSAVDLCLIVSNRATWLGEIKAMLTIPCGTRLGLIGQALPVRSTGYKIVHDDCLHRPDESYPSSDLWKHQLNCLTYTSCPA